MIRIFVFLLVSIVVLCSCSSKQLVVGASCLTCFNNPVTGQPINYDKSKYSNDTKAANGSIHNTFSVTPIAIDNFYYHWAARTSDPYSHTELLASFYFPEYRQGNEFDRSRLLKTLTPIIHERIDLAKNSSIHTLITRISLPPYDFGRKGFNFSMPVTMQSFSSRDILGDVVNTHTLDLLNKQSNVFVTVLPDDAENALRESVDYSGSNARQVVRQLTYEITSVTQECNKVCKIFVTARSESLSSVVSNRPIGQFMYNQI